MSTWNYLHSTEKAVPDARVFLADLPLEYFIWGALAAVEDVTGYRVSLNRWFPPAFSPFGF